jgi:TP901-1 family phage major tail protein
MAADTGRNFLCKLGTGTGAVTVAAMRSTAFTINGELVDTTNKDSAGFRDLLGSAGVASLQITAAGVLTGSTTSNALAARAKAKSLDLYTLLWDGTTGTLTGTFQVQSYQANAEHNDAQQFSCTLESSGSWTG